jgi:hypothetical protein
VSFSKDGLISASVSLLTKQALAIAVITGIDSCSTLACRSSATSLVVPKICELAHNHLRSSGTEYGSRRAQAMTQRPAKRIPQWLTIDLLVIVVSLAIIGFFIAIDIYTAID